MWRQGDVLIDQTDAIRPTAGRLKKLILATGDSTGHRHMIKNTKSAELYAGDAGVLYLRVITDEAIISHPEHGPITLPRGQYRIWKQREFTDTQPRPVYD